MLEHITLAVVAVLVVAALRAAWALRCTVGLHPRRGRRMRPGRTEKRRRGNGVVGGDSVAVWSCGLCGADIGVTRQRLSAKVRRELQAQVGVSRRRSKDFLYEVRRRNEEATG